MELMRINIYVSREFTYGIYKYILRFFIHKEKNHCNTVIRLDRKWFLYDDSCVGLYKPHSEKNIFDLVQYAEYERCEN
jgi:hypothetical protein